MLMSSYVMIGIPILIILLIIAYITLYNRLNRLRIKVEEAGADIDVALEKRFDLLSEEIEAVKKYLSHEYQIMTDLTAARVGDGSQKHRPGDRPSDPDNGTNPGQAGAKQYPEARPPPEGNRGRRPLP